MDPCNCPNPLWRDFTFIVKDQHVKFLTRYFNATSIKLTVANNNRLTAYNTDVSQWEVNSAENLMEQNTRCYGELNTTRRICHLGCCFCTVSICLLQISQHFYPWFKPYLYNFSGLLDKRKRKEDGIMEKTCPENVLKNAEEEMRFLVAVVVNKSRLQGQRSFHSILIINLDYGNSTSYILQ